MRFQLLCTLLVVMLIYSEAADGSVLVTVDSGILRTWADDNSGGALWIDDAAGFGINGTTRNVVDGSASAKVTYNWTNSGNQAIFEAVTISQHLGEDDNLTFNLQNFQFTVTETVNYLIEGNITGTAQDSGDLALLHAYLDDGSNFVGREYDFSSATSFNNSIDGVQQGNWGYGTTGALSGQIGPGTYYFYGLVQLQDHNDHLGTMDATGFTRLTLTSAAVPEPSTYIVFTGLILCFGLASWWRKRRMQAA